MNQPEEDWTTLIEGLREMVSFYPNDLVVIGGVAVYLLTEKNLKETPEISHDVDFALSIEAYSELRELYETTKNKRLGKSQFVRKGLEYDVYVDNQNNLAVPYEALVAGAVEVQGIKVANPAHLLVLKLAAAKDRQSSSKGDKDVRDLIRIGCFLSEEDLKMTAPFLMKEDLLFLDNIAKTKLKSFMAVAGENPMKSRDIRQNFQDIVDNLFNETTHTKHSNQRPRIP